MTVIYAHFPQSLPIRAIEPGDEAYIKYDHQDVAEAFAPTPALAICLALLRALHATQGAVK